MKDIPSGAREFVKSAQQNVYNNIIKRDMAESARWAKDHKPQTVKKLSPKNIELVKQARAKLKEKEEKNENSN